MRGGNCPGPAASAWGGLPWPWPMIVWAPATASSGRRHIEGKSNGAALALPSFPSPVRRAGRRQQMFHLPARILLAFARVHSFMLIQARIDHRTSLVSHRSSVVCCCGDGMRRTKQSRNEHVSLRPLGSVRAGSHGGFARCHSITSTLFLRVVLPGLVGTVEQPAASGGNGPAEARRQGLASV